MPFRCEKKDANDNLKHRNLHTDYPSGLYNSIAILLLGDEYLVVFTSNRSERAFVLKGIERRNDIRTQGGC